MAHKLLRFAPFLPVLLVSTGCLLEIDKGVMIRPDAAGSDASEHDAADAAEDGVEHIEPDSHVDLYTEPVPEPLTLDNADNEALWTSSDNDHLTKSQDTIDMKEGSGCIEVEAAAANVVSDQTRYSVNDANVRSDEPDTNYGSVTLDDIYEKNTIKKRLFVAFDLGDIDTDATVSSAVFFLNVNEFAFGGITAGIYRALGSWNEASLTWGSKPSTSSKLYDMSLTGTNEEKDVWRSIAITSLVQSCVHEANYGWMLMRGDGSMGDNRARVYHREKGEGYAPRLVLSYTEPKSLNDTLTRDLGPGNEKDLTGYNLIIFWIKSTRAGTYLRFGIGETDWNDMTWDVAITSAGTWAEKAIDISGIPDADKDAIRHIGFQVTNADASFTMKFDDIRAVM